MTTFKYEEPNFQCKESNDSPVWSSLNVMQWKLLPEQIGGGIPFIQSFKDGWVKHNKSHIKISTTKYQLPPELLAGVCWIEVGGDPNFIDSVAFNVRAFDWSGPEWVDKYLTITRPPEKTSFGAVSIQLRTALKTMGLDVKNTSTSKMRELANCLQKDIFNIDIVGKHLFQLIEYDDFKSSLPNLTMDQIKIIGARYNRGMELSLDQIKKNTSYGNFIVKNWARFQSLLM